MRLLLFVTGGRGGVGIGFAVLVMLVSMSIAVAVGAVHALVQALGFFPAMLGTGRTEGNQDSRGEEGEGGFLHETEMGVGNRIGGVFRLARVYK